MRFIISTVSGHLTASCFFYRTKILLCYRDGIVVDQELNPIHIFPNVYNILTELRHKHYVLFLFANRHFVRQTKSLLRKFKIQQLFDVQYFMDGSKIQHIYRYLQLTCIFQFNTYSQISVQ